MRWLLMTYIFQLAKVPKRSPKKCQKKNLCNNTRKCSRFRGFIPKGLCGYVLLLGIFIIQCSEAPKPLKLSLIFRLLVIWIFGHPYFWTCGLLAWTSGLWTGFPDFWTTSSFGISGLWTCGHLNFWSSKLLDIWTSGLLDIWNSGLLDFKPSGLWNSGHLNFHSDPCPDWDILDLPCMLHKSQIPNVLPGHHHRVVAWASRFRKSCHALCLTVGNNWSHTCISFDNNCQSFAVITMIF